MSDNLRGAAQAALETLEDVFGKNKIDVSAINNLRAALAEPVVKESLTTQPSDTPLTDALDSILTEREIDRALDFARDLERELAAAIASFSEERERAQREGERVIAALAQRDKAIAFLHVYRNDTPLGNQPHMIAHEVDLFLKECGK